VFLLIRHASWDVGYAPPDRFRGHGIDLVPLTPAGLVEAENLALRLADGGSIDKVVSSPMTRALQTAMILSRRLMKPVDVELDLHEWVPDLSQQ
jgi:broad specificity phosphatase PhoE